MIATIGVMIAIQAAIIMCAAFITILVRRVAMTMTLIFVATFSMFTINNTTGYAQKCSATDCKCEPRKYVHDEYLQNDHGIA
jgi:hypothetical protein